MFLSHIPRPTVLRHQGPVHCTGSVCVAALRSAVNGAKRHQNADKVRRISITPVAVTVAKIVS